MESRARTIVKAVIWNVIGVIVMTLVGLILTGSVTLGGSMAAISTVVGLICYVAYERVWARIGWGRYG